MGGEPNLLKVILKGIVKHTITESRGGYFETVRYHISHNTIFLINLKMLQMWYDTHIQCHKEGTFIETFRFTSIMYQFCKIR